MGPLPAPCYALVRGPRFAYRSALLFPERNSARNRRNAQHGNALRRKMRESIFALRALKPTPKTAHFHGNQPDNAPNSRPLPHLLLGRLEDEQLPQFGK